MRPFTWSFSTRPTYARLVRLLPSLGILLLERAHAACVRVCCVCMGLGGCDVMEVRLVTGAAVVVIRRLTAAYGTETFARGFPCRSVEIERMSRGFSDKRRGRGSLLEKD